MGCLAAKSYSRIVVMFKRCVATLIIVVIARMLTIPPVRAQESAQSEREAMYYRYLEFASLVKGGAPSQGASRTAGAPWRCAEGAWN